MYYEIHGEGEPLVLIAGFSADHFSWYPVVEQLAQRYQIILLDNRGAGQTDVPKGPYSIEQMAQDIVDLCSKLKIEKASFIGNSMGGYILQTLAYRHPTLLKAAIISNSGMTLKTAFHAYVAAQLELIKANAPVTSLMRASSAWAFSYHFLTSPGKLDEIMQLMLANPYPFTITGYEGQYAAINHFNSSQWAKEIKTPTLIVTSDQDIILPPLLSEALAHTIPHSHYYCFEECGHLPHIEYPEKYSKVIMAFLDEA